MVLSIYKRFVADGDSSVFNKLTEAKIYANVIIEKIECRNHLYRNFIRLEYRKVIKVNLLRFRIAVKKAVAYHKASSQTFTEKVFVLNYYL